MRQRAGSFEDAESPRTEGLDAPPGRLAKSRQGDQFKSKFRAHKDGGSLAVCGKHLLRSLCFLIMLLVIYGAKSMVADISVTLRKPAFVEAAQAYAKCDCARDCPFAATAAAMAAASDADDDKGPEFTFVHPSKQRPNEPEPCAPCDEGRDQPCEACIMKCDDCPKVDAVPCKRNNENMRTDIIHNIFHPKCAKCTAELAAAEEQAAKDAAAESEEESEEDDDENDDEARPAREEPAAHLTITAARQWMHDNEKRLGAARRPVAPEPVLGSVDLVPDRAPDRSETEAVIDPYESELPEHFDETEAVIDPYEGKLPEEHDDKPDTEAMAKQIVPEIELPDPDEPYEESLPEEPESHDTKPESHDTKPDEQDSYEQDPYEQDPYELELSPDPLYVDMDPYSEEPDIEWETGEVRRRLLFADGPEAELAAARAEIARLKEALAAARA